jgi:hypothetical protein
MRTETQVYLEVTRSLKTSEIIENWSGRWFFHNRWCSDVPMIGGGGGSTNSVEDTRQRELRSGGGNPLVRGSTQFAMSETRILTRLLRMYFPRNREFGSAFSKLRNFRGVNPPTPRHCSDVNFHVQSLSTYYMCPDRLRQILLVIP